MPRDNRMSDNRIIAGPMLRRCSTEEICLWLATSYRPAQLSGGVYAMGNDGRPGLRLDDEAAQRRTVCLGHALYVHLLRIKPTTGAYPTGELLAYDLDLEGQNLAQLGMTSGPEAITYPGAELPTLYLAPANEPRPLLHGSCRKFHGEGEDALVAADLQIGEHLFDTRHRPAALFLTGDQIYADDVATPISRHLTRLGQSLCPDEAAIPGIDIPLSDLGPGERGRQVKRKARFSSAEADNHLISFGDYAAMYLMAWTPWAWPDNFPSALRAVPNRRGVDIPALELERSHYKHQIRHLQRARKGINAVRRALANLPSYTIFDDHDVTDDWNISREWFLAVQGDNPTGRRIIANALAAYWAFQGWGNNPDAFSEAFIADIEAFLSQAGPTQKIETQFTNRLLQWDQWDYVAPTEPRALVLDTRTQRKLDDDDHLPWLIKREALERLPHKVAAARWPGGTLIVISATPLLGMRPVEAVQQVIDNLGLGPELADFEPWTANRHGMGEFIHQLQDLPQLEHAVLLSGDVHYAFTSRGELSNDRGRLKLSQLTSSPQKNISILPDLVWAALKVVRHGWRLHGWRHQQPRSLELEQIEQLESHNPLDAELQGRHFRARNLLQKPESVVVTDNELETLRIPDTPDWTLACDYLTMAGRVVHKTNNLGQLDFDDRGNLRHRLWFMDEEGLSWRETGLD